MARQGHEEARRAEGGAAEDGAPELRWPGGSFLVVDLPVPPLLTAARAGLTLGGARAGGEKGTPLCQRWLPARPTPPQVWWGERDTELISHAMGRHPDERANAISGWSLRPSSNWGTQPSFPIHLLL